jgi:hypothetical protein
LHVVESIGAQGLAQNHVVQIQNSSDSSEADVLALRINSSEFCTCANFITFFNGSSTDGIGAVEANGSNGVAFKTVGADYAEWLPKVDPGEKIERGEIVGLFGGEVSKQTDGADRVMALSTGAAVAGNAPDDEELDAHALVAFIGQVEVPVRGVVQAGDFILPSGQDDGTGIAIAPEQITTAQFAQVVGQAWQSSDDNGLKSIRIVVGLAQQDPTIQRLLDKVDAQETRLAELEARLLALEVLTK